ncbi:MAG: hypothetical protein KJZ84_02905 [Bryobacteraceae bacterium]|nr:hypothetical protein [Bryobacteraceae bacterium]
MTAPAVSTFGRAGISLGALLASVALFSVLFTLVFGRAGAFTLDLFPTVFFTTMTIAVPVWFLYLWLVLALEDAEGWRFWVILATGTLIGPVSQGVWGLLQIESGSDPHRVWQGDPLIGLGLGARMVFAMIVGCMTSAFYGLALRRMHLRFRGRG